MLRDAEHFKSKIGGLDGAGDAGDYLVGLVNAKIVPKPKQPVPVTEPYPAETQPNESQTSTGRSSGEPPSRGQSEVDGKGKQEEKQVEEAKEQAAA
jgi:vacuolar protein sorting-associated protein 54